MLLPTGAALLLVLTNTPLAGSVTARAYIVLWEVQDVDVEILKTDDSAAVTSAGRPFHTLHSDRLPCLQYSTTTGPNACPNSTVAGICLCYHSSNAFGAVEVDHLPTCKFADYDPATCLTPVDRVAEALRPMPAGQRAVSWLALYRPQEINGKRELSSLAAMWDLDSNNVTLPWADDWQAAVRPRLRAWFANYSAKADRPAIDMVFYDLEALSFGFGHSFAFAPGAHTNFSAVFGPWQADSRWPALLAELNAAGAPFGVEFSNMTAAAETACCRSDICYPGCDTTDYHQCVINTLFV
jgi:hypothetical protein